MTNFVQFEEMSDKSMISTLAAQAHAIWPQEELIFKRHAEKLNQSSNIKILDVGCGTGEITSRLARLFKNATIIGVDVIESHLNFAREQYEKEFGERISFQLDDAFNLKQKDHSFDLVVCRHVLHAVQQPELALKEFQRVLKPNGIFHLLQEDYGMIFTAPIDTTAFFRDGPIAYGAASQSSLQIGRETFSILKKLGFKDSQITIDYLTIDTLRVDRKILISMISSWRDGYTEPLAEKTNLTVEQVETYWKQVLETLEDPNGYFVWQIPIVCVYF